MNERQSDFEWLQQFARAGNQSAFRELVRRHIDLVFATAMRKVGDAGGAEEISQNVFGVLARKAWQFAPDDSLPAWLHKTTLLESQAWQRGEMRRRRREQAAAELGTTMKTPDEQPAFHALVPLLDEALLSLREKDREALLLRYYESQSLRDVGAALGVSDDTAQKRVQSALENLSQFFQRRGFKTATVAATTAALQHTAASASAATVSLVFNAALQAAPPALVGLSALLARFASLTKVQTAAVCVVIAVGPVAWQISEQREAQAALAHAKTQLVATQSEFNVVQTEIQRLTESTTQLDDSLAAAREAAARSAETAQKFETWKQRIRGQLLAADYQWPEDSPFVRIPKPMLPQLQVHQPISQPGVIKQETRELLGLTPVEREQAEAALHNHFATMDNLMESNRYETNRTTLANLPKDALAGQVWGLPALGDEVKQREVELQAALKTVLGDERWPLVEEQLKAYGRTELRRILNLDAGERGQELAVWVQEREGKLVAGFSWGEQNSSFSQSGLALSLFAPEKEFPIPGASAEDYLNTRQLSASLSGPALAWLRQQAETRLGKKGDR
jgi:RNA polymerase sigma factor (sigma-70 family)